MHELITATVEVVKEPDSLPVWAYLVALMIVVGVPALVGLLAQHPLKRGVDTIASDAKEARDQTANTHDTNLRDDLDEVKGIVIGMARRFDRMERWMTDLVAADEDTSRTMDRRREAVDRALTEEREQRAAEMATLRQEIRAAVAQHVTDCPLRHDT